MIYRKYKFLFPNSSKNSDAGWLVSGLTNKMNLHDCLQKLIQVSGENLNYKLMLQKDL